MKPSMQFLGFGVLAAALALPVVGQNNTVSVNLKTRVDTKDATVGETVTAVTTDSYKMNGKTVVPKGSELTGQIAKVTAAADKKAPATLEIDFTKAVTPSHQTIGIEGGIAEIGDSPGSDSFDNGAAVTISPAANGATQIKTQHGNLSLANGQRLQVQIKAGS